MMTQYQTVLGSVCRSMNLCLVRIWEGLYVHIPFSLVFGDIVSVACDDGSIKLFGLSVDLRMVGRRFQVFNT